MKELYRYCDISEIQSHPDSLRLRQAINSASRSVWENESQAKELVAKRIINAFGYPNNIEARTYQYANKIEFIDVKTNEILASVETINDGMMFYTETKYYGDWYK